MPEVANLSAAKRSPPEYDAKAARADAVVCEVEGITTPKSRQVTAIVESACLRVKEAKEIPPILWLFHVSASVPSQLLLSYLPLESVGMPAGL